MTWCLGVDPSKARTGWCLIDTGPKPWVIKSGSFAKLEGDDVAIYSSAFMTLGRLLKHTVPKEQTERFFQIERPMYQIATVRKKSDGFGSFDAPAGNPKTQCILHGIASAYSTAAALMKFQPYESGMVMPSVWRKSFFGKGFKTGNWKKAAKDHLAHMKIGCNNHDEAEAIAIAYVMASHISRFK